MVYLKVREGKIGEPELRSDSRGVQHIEEAVPAGPEKRRKVQRHRDENIRKGALTVTTTYRDP